MIMNNGKISAHRKRAVRSLSALSLNDEDLNALRRQGSVCREKRGGETYYKLRFRSAGGQQRVRYLGKDLTVATKIRQELEVLQFPRRQLQSLRRNNIDARKLLHRVKQTSRSGLEELGFCYHGFQIRKRRS